MDFCIIWYFLKVFSGGGCYITTAVVQKMGLDDASIEMQKLRKFRKEYILDNNDKSLLSDFQEYYILGQIIFRWADSRFDSEEIWKYVSDYVFQVIDFIDQNNYDEAYKLFKKRTLNINQDIMLNYHKNAFQQSV